MLRCYATPHSACFPLKNGKEAGVAGTQRAWRRARRERVERTAAKGHMGGGCVLGPGSSEEPLKVGGHDGIKYMFSRCCPAGYGRIVKLYWTINKPPSFVQHWLSNPWHHGRANFATLLPTRAQGHLKYQHTHFPNFDEHEEAFSSTSSKDPI